MLTSTKVFISYSWDSDEHKQKVLGLANTLRAVWGIDAEIDRYVRAVPPYTPSQGWDVWMSEQIESAEFVLIIFTETYKRRFEGKEELGKGLGVSWEGTIIRNDLCNAQLRDTKFIPVVFSESDLRYVPSVLNSRDKYVLTDDNSFRELCYRLRKQNTIIKPEIQGEPLPLPAEPVLFSPHKPPLDSSLQQTPESLSEKSVKPGELISEPQPAFSKTNIGAALFAIVFISIMITMFIIFLQLSPRDSTGNFNPKREQPDQEVLSNQDHHSLSPENSKTKAPNLECSYENLRNQLKVKKFKEADITTLNLMRSITKQQNEPSLSGNDILNIDCQNFYKIDYCWKKENQNFGFSVQSQIWKEMRDKEKVGDDKIYGLFAKRVGWNFQEESRWLKKKMTCNYLNANDEKNIPQGNLPCLIYERISGQVSPPAYIQERIDKCNNSPGLGSIN